MTTGRPDMKRWPRHKSGPKRGRMMSYEELRQAGLKPVYLSKQVDAFPDEPRRAKTRKAKAKATEKAKATASDVKKEIAKAARNAREYAREERAAAARVSGRAKEPMQKRAEAAETAASIFGGLARLWHQED